MNHLGGDGFLYYLIGHRHGLQLLVSLWSLRNSGAWDGPVHIACGCDESLKIASHIYSSNLGDNVTLHRFQHAPCRNGAYLGKTRLDKHSPFDRTIFTDADTIWTGQPFDELWANGGEIVLTKWSTWTAKGKITRGRINRWRDFEPELCARLIQDRVPCINTGIMSWTTDCQFFVPWNELAAKQPGFIVDETSCQVIHAKHPHRLVDGKYNASPLFHEGKPDEVVAWHFHGRHHVRGLKGKPIFMPVMDKVWEDNVANCQSWGEWSDHKTLNHLKEWNK